MKKLSKKYLLLLGICLYVTEANAQLSSNPDKFLGNITTYGQVDYGNEAYYTLWNQITPENESKWDAIEPSHEATLLLVVPIGQQTMLSSMVSLLSIILLFGVDNIHHG